MPSFHPSLWLLATAFALTLTEGFTAEAEPVRTLRVAAVQMRSSRDLQENVRRIDGFLREAADQGVRVAVFPECALSGYSDQVTKLSAHEIAAAEGQVVEACRKHDVYALVGLPWRDGDKLYNSASIISPRDGVIERYHKVQLAESWPDAGEHLSVFRIDDVPCSVIICHDERYPELVRLPVLAGARVVFYLSHESGLKSERKIDPYRAQIQARAVENTVFVVHANAPANEDLSGSHGQSRIIAPDGNLIGPEAPIFGEQILTATLELKQATAGNALRSVKRGPLADWWSDGMKRVRIVGQQRD